MLCYRDMTFCGNSDTCSKVRDCHRGITKEVQSAADSFGLPLAISDFKETCSEYKEKELDYDYITRDLICVKGK